MRKNQAILDEAARSVRRTFIGSIAGSLGMLAVVGAAGAYGMPERLTAQALTVALATFNTKISPMLDRAGPAVDRAVTVASDTTRRAPESAPAPYVLPEPEQQAPVVRTLPETEAQPSAAPAPAVTQPAVPAAAPRETDIAAVPAVAAPVEPAAPVAAAAVPEPVPAKTANAMPGVSPDAAPERVFAPASLVFEMPKPDDIPPLSAMPEIEPVAAAPAASEVAKPAVAVAPQESRQESKPDQSKSDQADAVETPNPADYPKTVMVRLPEPKPPLTPAQRLDLHGKDYDKAETCLAQAVYFEARNEPARGQEAVAQVVLNRVFSPYYPKDVCSVVYQNAHRHLSCQFTFACDGKSEAIRERGAWARATRIAKQTLDAKIWLPAVAKATHYHAAYVHPNWIRDMRVMVRYGLHTFYRPRNWGDGSNEPAWGSGAAKKPQGRAS